MSDSIIQQLATLSAPVDPNADEVAVILAAGHGKRIKSNTSKMLHEIWGVPSVVRVAEACRDGLGASQQVIVVGIKAEEVAAAVNERLDAIFAYQATQDGTGHAVMCGLECYGAGQLPARVYIFPGDMGLLRADAVREFKQRFDTSGQDMMVMTGIYDGPLSENQYGRILRVPATDETGASSGDDEGRVIEIKEHKDILALEGDYRVEIGGRAYCFTKQQLLELREFNAGVYAFKGEHLSCSIGRLSNDNAQGEVYLTDLISVFNNTGLSVGATSPSDNTVVLGFNNKSVLRQMEDLSRQRVYERLKDTITFEAPDDFYIDDRVVDDIERLDEEHGHLDITVGKGARINAGAKLNINVSIGREAELNGSIELGKNVSIGEQVMLGVYPGQTMTIGDNVEILKGDMINGVVTIGDGARIEAQVRITGSDEFPTSIGKNVIIKGTTYVFGTTIEDDVMVEHSILKHKRVERIERKDGTVQDVRYYLPHPEGIDCISGTRDD